MTSKYFYRLLLPAFIFLALFSINIPTFAAERKPNVLFILADDLGWSDTTLYGTTKFYKTPHIQRLAKRGMTFTRAYSSSPLCSPTRSSILTGLSPARIGITSPTCHLPKVQLTATPGTNGPVNKKAILPNSATRFDTKYYSLAEMFQDNGYATGHFGKWHLGAAPYSPLEHGFDVDVPHWPGPGPAGSYVAPWKFPDFDPNTPDEHIEDRMAEEAVAFMKKHKDEPFFLNYWMFSVHAPFDAKQALIDQYKTKIDPQDPQRSPTYAAMIESMDDAIGRLLDTLDELKIAGNTIIVFASDNGGNMYNEVDGTTATSNAPLRGGKATMYEGGVRGPAIVVYPGNVKADSQSDQIIQSADFYPTLLELLHIKPQTGQSFDGVSIVPALHNKPLARDAIFTYFPHSPPVPQWLPASVSVHQGDWKLIRIFHGGENGQHRWKLFNLKEDIGEQNNLAKQQPSKVKQLDQLIDQFLKDTNAVLPMPNPKFDPSKYDPTLEGIGRLKGSSNAPKKKTGPAKETAGWRPSSSCELSKKGGTLFIQSTAGDPHITYRFAKPINEKSPVLQFTMTSNSQGNGQVFWQTPGKPFHRDRSQAFKPKHDNQSHTYLVKLPFQSTTQAIRIDPSTAAGNIHLKDVTLSTESGEVLYRWKIK